MHWQEVDSIVFMVKAQDVPMVAWMTKFEPIPQAGMTC